MADDEVRTDEIEEDDDWGGEPDEEGPAAPETSDSAASATKRNTMLAVLVAVLIAAGAGWYFVYGPGKPPPPPPPVVEAEPEPVVEEEPEPELPALDASDPFLRSLFAAITGNPDALAWLLGDDLARRIAVATDNVADGMSPRRALAPLSPTDSFRAEGDGEELHVHPAAFARYDAVAAALEGADSPGMARVIREALPILDAAYAELGPPRPDLRRGSARGARPDRGGSDPRIARSARRAGHALRSTATPALEELDDASKHLLRFGPENQAKVQEAARGLAERLRAGGRSVLAAGSRSFPVSRVRFASVPSVHFTPNLRRHLRVESTEVEGHTVSDALSRVFRDNPDLRSYVLDDQGRLRTHVVIYVDGRPVRDRMALADPLAEDAEIHVMQALSGGVSGTGCCFTWEPARGTSRFGGSGEATGDANAPPSSEIRSRSCWPTRGTAGSTRRSTSGTSASSSGSRKTAAARSPNCRRPRTRSRWPRRRRRRRWISSGASSPPVPIPVRSGAEPSRADSSGRMTGAVPGP